MEVGSQVSKQNLILGTHTSEGEQNYLMRAEVQLPLAGGLQLVSIVPGCVMMWAVLISLACLSVRLTYSV